MQLLDLSLGIVVAMAGTRLERAGSSIPQLLLPRRDLVRMHIELLHQLSQSFLFPDRRRATLALNSGERSLRLRRGAMISRSFGLTGHYRSNPPPIALSKIRDHSAQLGVRSREPGSCRNSRSSMAPGYDAISGSATRVSASSTVNSRRAMQVRTIWCHTERFVEGARSMTVRSGVVQRIPWIVVTSESGRS